MRTGHTAAKEKYGVAEILSTEMYGVTVSAS